MNNQKKGQAYFFLKILQMSLGFELFSKTWIK